MTDVDTRRPPTAGVEPGDRMMALLLQLAAAADRYLAASEANAANADRRRQLEVMLERAWDSIGADRRPTGARRQSDVPIYSRTNLPAAARWATYANVHATRMARLDGPFAVITIDGNLAYCSDGWIAVDSDGHPYPIAASQDGTYRLVTGT